MLLLFQVFFSLLHHLIWVKLMAVPFHQIDIMPLKHRRKLNPLHSSLISLTLYHSSSSTLNHIDLFLFLRLFLLPGLLLIIVLFLPLNHSLSSFRIFKYPLLVKDLSQGCEVTYPDVDSYSCLCNNKRKGKNLLLFTPLFSG